MKKILLSFALTATLLPSFGQSVVWGGRQYGPADYSNCTTPPAPSDPSAQECGYIPSKPRSEIEQVLSDQDCVNLMRTIIPLDMQRFFNIDGTLYIPKPSNGAGKANCFVSSIGAFVSSDRYPGNPPPAVQPICGTGPLATSCLPENEIHGGLFREIMKNFKNTPQYPKIQNLEDRQRGSFGLVFSGWLSMSDCSMTLTNTLSNPDRTSSPQDLGIQLFVNE